MINANGESGNFESGTGPIIALSKDGIENNVTSSKQKLVGSNVMYKIHITVSAPITRIEHSFTTPTTTSCNSFHKNSPSAPKKVSTARLSFGLGFSTRTGAGRPRPRYRRHICMIIPA
eukprot:m.110097 g.110097  ORF g.110097 m.110097 type:complete len:118 (-) comp28009_c1_seq1:36-389(-)